MRMYKILYGFLIALFFGANLNAQLNINFQSNNLEPTVGETVEIDVIAENFTDIVSVQYSILWDSTVLTYASITNVTTELPQFIFSDDPNATSSVGTPVNRTNGLDGILTVSWSQLSTEEFTLPPNTRLFTIELTAVGDPCAETTLTIGDSPLGIEVIVPDPILFLVDIGAESNTLEFQIPGVGCSGVDPGEDDLGFIAGSVEGPSNDTVCMPIQVVNFSDIQTFQGSVDWDPSEMTFTGVDNINPDVTGLTAGSFNTDSTMTTGTLSYAWFDFSGVNPLNFPDSTSLFDICFVPVGNEGDCFDVTFVNMPTPVEASNSMGQSVPFYTEAGEVCIGEGTIGPVDGELVITAESTNFPMNSNVCVNFTATDFDSIGSIQYNMVWDDSVLSYTGVTNFNDDMGITEGNFNPVASDRLVLSWNDPSSSIDGVSIDDGSLMYSVCFDVIGDCDATTTIDFASGNISIEIANGNAEPVPFTLVPTDVVVVCTKVCDETITQPSCNGELTGSIILNCTGDNNYSWTDIGGNTIGNNNSLIAVGAGTYNVVVTDNGTGTTCMLSYTIDEPDPIVITGEPLDAVCNSGGMISISGSGGTGTLSYSWTGPTSIPDNETDPQDLAPGTYTVTAVDENNCSESEDFIIMMSGGGESISLSSTPADCTNGGTITTSLSGFSNNTSFVWTPTLPDLSNVNVPAGTYTLNVTDNDTGCSLTESVTVAQTMDNPPSVTGSSTNAGCDGGSIALDLGDFNPNPDISWDNGLASIPNPTDLAANTYSVTVTDAVTGCMGTASFTITDEIDPLSLEIEDIADALCFGDNGSASIVITGGCNPTCTVIDANTNMPLGSCSEVMDFPVGTYIVSLIDGSIVMTETFSISGPSEDLGLTIDGVVNVCLNLGDDSGAISTTPTGGTGPYTVGWVDQDMVVYVGEDITNLTEGMYTPTVTDANNCIVTFPTVTVTISNDSECSENDLELGDVSIDPIYNGFNVSCNGECDGVGTLEILSGNPPYTVEYGNESISAVTNSVDLMNLCEGVTNISVTDASGQTANASVNIAETPEIILTIDNIVDADENMSNGSATVLGVGGTGSYEEVLWSNGQMSFTLIDVPTGNYILDVTDSNGCVETISVFVDEKEPTGIPCYTGLNVLTPNGDNSNDVFMIECAEDNPNTLGIYDRYGRTVYETTNYANDWGGEETNGTIVPEGPYFWVMEITFPSGETRVEKGTITVLR